MKRNPKSNRALRLDNFLVLDPDSEDAVELLDSLDKAGKLPPTVTYKTWRGFPQRIYMKVEGLSPFKIISNGIELEVRTGNGQYVLIPPSRVKNSQYQFEPNLSPAEAKVAELPIGTLQELQGMVKKVEKETDEAKAVGGQPQDLNKLKIPIWAKNLIEKGGLGGHPSRSERDHAVIGALKKVGCNLDTIEAIFANYSHWRQVRGKRRSCQDLSCQELPKSQGKT